MYRLLIVDDEQEIADWLYELFSGQNQPDLDIYRAYSGESALELLGKAKFDIVLTDIRMPGVSGMQLLAEIKRSWPLCRVIFLTGYNEFDYVYEAIKHEGVQYLLKTEKDRVIVGALEKAVEELEASERDRELVERAREQMELAQPLLRDRFLTDLLRGAVGSETCAERFAALCIDLDASAPVYLVAGRFDDGPSAISPGKLPQYHFAVKLKMEEYLRGGCIRMAMVSVGAAMVWLIQPARGEPEEPGANGRILSVLRGMLESVQSVCRESLMATLSFVVSDGPADWRNVAVRYEALEAALNYNTGMGGELIFSESDVPKAGGENRRLAEVDGARQIRLQLKKLSMLPAMLERGKSEEFFPLLREAASCLMDFPSRKSSVAQEVFYSVSLMFLSHMNKWNLSESVARQMDVGFLTQPEQCADWADAIPRFEELAAVLFSLQKKEQEKFVTNAVLRVCQYIRDHLDGDISLIRLAEQAHFNPSYLSRLFKQSTGMTISDYSSNLKVERAKELLRAGELKVAEIALAVGFDSPNYFARFFKRATNLTPQEFRDLPGNL